MRLSLYVFLLLFPYSSVVDDRVGRHIYMGWISFILRYHLLSNKENIGNTEKPLPQKLSENLTTGLLNYRWT